MSQAIRQPVDYRFDALNWDFLKQMAQIAHYAEGKYGQAEQYTESRLVKDKSPMNHAIEHYRAYVTGEPHDHFGDPRFHLAAIAYNCMIEFLYHTRDGHITSLLTVNHQGGANGESQKQGTEHQSPVEEVYGSGM